MTMSSFSRPLAFVALALGLAALGNGCLAQTDGTEKTERTDEAITQPTCPTGYFFCPTSKQGCIPNTMACLITTPDPGCSTCNAPAPAPTGSGGPIGKHQI